MHRPFRVMVDARMLVGRFSGVARFVTRLIDELSKLEDLEIVALCGCEVFTPWADRGDIEVVTSSFGRRDRTAVRRLWWEERNLRGLIRRARVDLFHATWNTGVPGFCPVPAVLTIHDLIPWSDPKAHFTTVFQRWSYRRAMRRSVRRASSITTVSDYVRRQVVTALNVEPWKVATVCNGVDMPSPDSARASPSSTPYALYVGGHEPRKNVAGVLRAMQRYRERFGDGLELRLTGHPASLSADATDVYRRLRDKPRVRFLGDIDDAELARHYSHARVLLMLSHDEGFGLPVLEAMAHGCPVVAASNASLPEVVGDAGLLVDADNPNAVCEAVRLLAEPSDRREEFIKRGRSRARAFGWDATAGRMREIYERVVREKARPSLAGADPRMDAADTDDLPPPGGLVLRRS